MKNIFLIIFLVAIGFYGCKDMDDLAQPYYDEGEIIYLQKVDSLVAMSGRNRVKFKYLLISDPKVEQTVVSYNNGENELIVDLNKTNSVDTVEVMIDNLTEKVHVFEFKNINAKGLSSVVTEAVVPVYGDSYAEKVSLLNQRKVVAVEAVFPDKALLYWGDVENEEIYSSRLTYTSYANNPEGEIAVQTVSAAETVTEVSGVKFGESISVQNVHKPAADAIDEFLAKEVAYQIPAQIFPIPGTWVFQDSCKIDYSSLGAGVHNVSGLDTYVESTNEANKFKTKLGLEGGNWRLGLIVNEDYSIDLYEAGHNDNWTLTLEYEAEENYYDPATKIIHLKYRFTIPGAWGGRWASTDVNFKRK